MKRLIERWISPLAPSTVRLSAQSVRDLSARLVDLGPFLPSEFSRKPRSLSELSRFKATEFRSFLLYLGPSVLRGILNDAAYKNFLLFHVSIWILINPSLLHLSSYARDYLVSFVKHCIEIYGGDFVSYNVHNLIHLPSDCDRYGALDNFSAFPFENFYGKLKKMLHGPQRPIVQIYRRVTERLTNFQMEDSGVNQFSLKYEHNEGPLPPTIDADRCAQFKEIRLDNCIVKCSNSTKADCFVCVCDKIVVVDNIISSEGILQVIGREFSNSCDLYTYPCNSSEIGIYMLSELNRELKTWRLSDVTHKMVVLPSAAKFVAFPLSHTNA